jgi:ribosomal protein S20
MPVTKTAKRALRGSVQKAKINKIIVSKLEIAVRIARKHPSKESILKAISLTDKASKKHAIHKNKASRIKSLLSKLVSKTKTAPKKKASSKK